MYSVKDIFLNRFFTGTQTIHQTEIYRQIPSRSVTFSLMYWWQGQTHLPCCHGNDVTCTQFHVNHSFSRQLCSRFYIGTLLPTFACARRKVRCLTSAANGSGNMIVAVPCAVLNLRLWNTTRHYMTLVSADILPNTHIHRAVCTIFVPLILSVLPPFSPHVSPPSCLPVMSSVFFFFFFSCLLFLLHLFPSFLPLVHFFPFPFLCVHLCSLCLCLLLFFQISHPLFLHSFSYPSSPVSHTLLLDLFRTVSIATLLSWFLPQGPVVLGDPAPAEPSLEEAYEVKEEPVSCQVSQVSYMKQLLAHSLLLKMHITLGCRIFFLNQTHCLKVKRLQLIILLLWLTHLSFSYPSCVMQWSSISRSALSMLNHHKWANVKPNWEYLTEVGLKKKIYICRQEILISVRTQLEICVVM